MFIWFQSLDRLFHVYMVPELGQVISCLYGSRAWIGYFMFIWFQSLDRLFHVYMVPELGFDLILLNVLRPLFCALTLG